VGLAVPAILDERELVTCPILGETGADAVNRIPRSMICGVIRPRMEEIFELLRERLTQVPAMRQGIRRVVLTGGGSQLNGVEQLAGEILRCSVRIARPHRFEGLPDAMSAAWLCRGLRACCATALCRTGRRPTWASSSQAPAMTRVISAALASGSRKASSSQANGTGGASTARHDARMRGKAPFACPLR
jgi:hypothetical protein